MRLSIQTPQPARSVAALPLLAGVVLSFVGCCLAGRILARVNCLRGFTRLQPAISYLTLYYPTVSQVRSLAREKVRPEKVTVLVGGNSILLGLGQGAADNWNIRLQKLLGDDFQVLNLAQYSAAPFEFGSVAAEMLLRDHPRLIFITNTFVAPLIPQVEPDGHPFLRYFFWQARARGLLADHPERDAVLHRLEAGRDEAFHELRRQCALDARLSFHDLWNAVTYRCFSTVWCPPLAASWTQPRQSYPDLNPIYPPVEARQLQAVSGLFVAYLRALAVQGRMFLSPAGGEKGWREPASPLPQTTRECLPPELRSRTLVLLNHHCPYFTRQLTAEEREGYPLAFAVTIRLYARAGIHAAEVGRDLPQRCYCDHEHLTAEGGRHLAEAVAPHIRALAGQLGYFERQHAVVPSARLSRLAGRKQQR